MDPFTRNTPIARWKAALFGEPSSMRIAAAESLARIIAEDALTGRKSMIAQSASEWIFDATHDHDWGKLRVLLDAGADVNARDNYGDTPLSSAAMNGLLIVMHTLLAAGADVNARNNYGDTPLTEAARQGHLEVVRVLLSAGADVNARSNNGHTPLIAAVGNGRLNVAALLKEHGATE